MDIKALLEQQEFLFLDGAMGTLIQNSGVSYEHVPETLNLTHPDLIASFHRAYVEAGSHIVYANTFGANAYKLEGCGYTVEQIVSAGIANAKKAVAGTGAYVALDIGPIGQLLEPAGSMTVEEAYDYYKEIILAGKDADLVVFETMTDLLELKTAVLAAKENSSLPIITTMTFERTGRTFTGVSPTAAAITLEGLGVDALGVNCSLGPDELKPIVAKLSKATHLPLVVKPNAGLPDPNSNQYDVFPPEFAESIASLVPYGIRIVGGCCGTTPEYIKETVVKLKDFTHVQQEGRTEGAVCSPSMTVILNQPRVMGERINPTGKKRMQSCLETGSLDYILNMALEEVSAGADMLGVNVGHPGIDELATMKRVLKALQGIVDVPLMIDSTETDVLEAGLRVYNGRTIINSVNGSEEKMQAIFPLAKKYGASVVGLALDENGIPPKAEQRFEIAKRIVERAESYGISRKDVYIDCLTMTVSSEQEAALETLKALHRVKTELGCKTILGVSNISFGLPNRGLVNSTFLTMALYAGLDVPIINPNVEAMIGAVRAFRVIAQYDENSVDYVASYLNQQGTAVATPVESNTADVFSAVYNGLKSVAAEATENLLKTQTAMEIINGQLIPALDKAGDDFENSRMFLPQLIQSANTAQECFEVIKKHIQMTGEETSVDKGKVILCTVKDDIHDIGKNIVKVLLDNYGFTVLDLGRDVAPETVVETAVKEQVRVIGLSALMTTTLKSMAETIRQLRECKELQREDGSSDVTILVGGAVLTPDYAKQIDADYYCKDAKETVDICKKIFQ